MIQGFVHVEDIIEFEKIAIHQLYTSYRSMEVTIVYKCINNHFYLLTMTFLLGPV